MAGPYNVVLQLQLQSPANLQSVVSDIQKRLSGINAAINIQINAASVQALSSLNSQLGSVQNNLSNTQTNADAATTAVNRLTTSLTNAGNQAGSANTSLGATNAALRASSLSLQEGASAFENFGLQAGLAARRYSAFLLAGGGLLVFINQLREGLGEALRFQRELVRISQVGDDTSGTIRELNQTITTLATTWGVSSRELANAALTIRQAGISAEDTRILLDALAKTALAPSFGPMTQTIEGAISAMRQFRLSGRETADALSSINAVSDRYAVSSRDIIEAIRRTGGQFRSLGGNLNELIATFTSVADTTRESSESIATGLRNIFGRLQRPEVITQLENLGISLRHTRAEAERAGDLGLTQQFVGPYQAIQRISTAVRELRTTDPRYSGIVETLGGERQISRVIPALQEATRSQEIYQVAIGGTNSLTDSAVKAQEAFLNQITKVKEQFLALIRTITESQGFRTFLNIVLQLASALTSLASALTPLIPLLTAVATFKLVQGVGRLAGGFLGGLGGQSPQYAQAGLRGFAGGGVVPGQGDSDSVFATLTPGEYVIKKPSARKIGYDNLERINRYAVGGSVRMVDGGESRFFAIDPDITKSQKKAIDADPSLRAQFEADIATRRGLTITRGQIDAFLRGESVTGIPSNQINDLNNAVGVTISTKTSNITRRAGELKALESNIASSRANKGISGDTIFVPYTDDRLASIGTGTINEAGTIPLSRPVGKFEVNQDVSSFLDTKGVKTISGKLDKHIISAQALQSTTDISNKVQTGISNVLKERFPKAKHDFKLDPGQLKTIEGYLLEQYIAGVVGHAPAGGTSLFDFTNTGQFNNSELAEIIYPKEVKANLIDAKLSSGGEQAYTVLSKYLNLRSRAGDFAVAKKAEGGHVDTVPALLTPGEYVLNRQAAQRIGYDNLERMNRAGVAHFAQGGSVRFADGGGELVGQAGAVAIGGNLSRQSAAIGLTLKELELGLGKLGTSAQQVSKVFIDVSNLIKGPQVTGAILKEKELEKIPLAKVEKSFIESFVPTQPPIFTGQTTREQWRRGLGLANIGTIPLVAEQERLQPYNLTDPLVRRQVSRTGGQTIAGVNTLQERPGDRRSLGQAYDLVGDRGTFGLVGGTSNLLPPLPGPQVYGPPIPQEIIANRLLNQRLDTNIAGATVGLGRISETTRAQIEVDQLRKLYQDRVRENTEIFKADRRVRSATEAQLLAIEQTNKELKGRASQLAETHGVAASGTAGDIVRRLATEYPAPPLSFGERARNYINTNRRGLLLGAGAIATTYGGQLAQTAAGTPEAAVLGGREGTYQIGQAIGGATTGAATGAAIGSFIPIIGTTVGAVVGGLIGLATSARAASEELKKIKTEREQRELSTSISLATRERRTLAPSELAPLQARFQQALPQGGNLLTLPLYEANAFLSSPFSSAGRDEYRRSRLAGFGGTQAQRDVVSQDVYGARRPELQSYYLERLQQIALANPGVGAAGVAERFRVENPEGRLRDQFGADYANFIRQLNANMSRVLSNAAETIGRASTTILIQQFDPLVRAMHEASTALKDLSTSTGLANALFTGQVSAGGPGANTVPEIGGLRPQEFRTRVAELTAPFGERGRTSAEAANNLDAVTRALRTAVTRPDIATRIGGGVLTLDRDIATEIHDTAATVLRSEFRERGGTPTGLAGATSLLETARIHLGGRGGDEATLASLYRTAGPEALVTRGIGDAARPVTEALRSLDTQAREAATAFAQSVTTFNQQMLRVAQLWDQVSTLSTNALRGTITSQARLVGESPEAALARRPIGELEAGLRERQESAVVAGGLAAGQAYNVPAIQAAIADITGRINIQREIQRTAAPVVSPPGVAPTTYQRATDEIGRLTLATARLGQALQNIANPTERNAIIQERLNTLYRDEAARLQLAQRFITGTPEQREQSLQGAQLLRTAANQGGIAGFGPSDIATLTGFGNNNPNLTFGGRRIRDLVEQYVSASPQAAEAAAAHGPGFELRPERPQIETLEARFVENLGEAVRAGIAHSELAGALASLQRSLVEGALINVNTRLADNMVILNQRVEELTNAIRAVTRPTTGFSTLDEAARRTFTPTPAAPAFTPPAETPPATRGFWETLIRAPFLLPRAVTGLAEGGPARGTDTVPAMLTPGEYVVNRDSARANRGLLEHINRRRAPVYLQEGGDPEDDPGRPDTIARLAVRREEERSRQERVRRDLVARAEVERQAEAARFAELGDRRRQAEWQARIAASRPAIVRSAPRTEEPFDIEGWRTARAREQAAAEARSRALLTERAADTAFFRDTRPPGPRPEGLFTTGVTIPEPISAATQRRTAAGRSASLLGITGYDTQYDRESRTTAFTPLRNQRAIAREARARSRIDEIFGQYEARAREYRIAPLEVGDVPYYSRLTPEAGIAGLLSGGIFGQRESRLGTLTDEERTEQRGRLAGPQAFLSQLRRARATGIEQPYTARFAGETRQDITGPGAEGIGARGVDIFGTNIGLGEGTYGASNFNREQAAAQRATRNAPRSIEAFEAYGAAAERAGGSPLEGARAVTGLAQHLQVVDFNRASAASAYAQGAASINIGQRAPGLEEQYNYADTARSRIAFTEESLRGYGGRFDARVGLTGAFAQQQIGSGAAVADRPLLQYGRGTSDWVFGPDGRIVGRRESPFPNRAIPISALSTGNVPFTGTGVLDTIPIDQLSRTRRFAGGGFVNGYGGMDTTPALLSAGEFVLSAGAAQAIGVNNLQRFNQGGPVGYYQDGGDFVGGETSFGGIRPSPAGNNFGEDITRMQSAFTSFSESISNLAGVISRIPPNIQLSANHNVNVTISGAEAFDSMEGSFAEMVKSHTETAINNFISKRFPEVGRLTSAESEPLKVER